MEAGSMGSKTANGAAESNGIVERQQLIGATPLQEQRLTVAGIPTAVLVGGEGPPLVLLHGPGEFALTWMRVMPELARTHHVIAPDLPGHGASGLGDGPLDRERMLAWLGDLIDQTCASPPYVAGHLVGGAIAMRFAIEHGDRLRGLALLDTHGLHRLRPTPAFSLTLINFLARPTAGSRDRFFRQCFVDMPGLQQQLGTLWSPLMSLALQGAGSPDGKLAVRSLMSHFGMRAIPDADLRRIRVPTALIWGRQDRQTSLSVAQRASAELGWPLYVIDGAADDPAFEQPAAVAEVLAGIPALS
jgi:pimeloyl-ACP methyl ester carboxylesterase